MIYLAIDSHACNKIFFKKYSNRVVSRLFDIKSRGSVKRFPQVFWTLGVYFKLTREESWDLLQILERAGKIEFVGTIGIKILEIERGVVHE